MFNKDQVVVASKYFNVLEIKRLYDMGYRHFGENRVDQILDKKVNLPQDIHWHMIGHLQRNKAKLIANEIEYLHTLDSLELAKILNAQLIVPLKCFIQINLANIDHKSGILRDKLDDFMTQIKKYDKIKVIGFMSMGVLENLETTDAIFKTLKAFQIHYGLEGLSIGMSDDYEIALKYDPMFLRIGSYFKSIV